MPTAIDRHELQRLLAEREAQLVEVLPAAEYEDKHLPMGDQHPAQAARARDDEPARSRSTGDRLLLRLSMRHEPASRGRLESIGFQQVYDYVAGKAYWGSVGLPLEGEADSGTQIGRLVVGDLSGSVRKFCHAASVVVRLGYRVVRGGGRGRRG